MPQQEQLSETTSTKILLPGIAEEVEGLFLSDTTLTCFPLRLRNSTASYSAFLRQRNLTGTRTAPRFDSYPDSDDEFDLDSDPLNCPNLTILATPQSRVVYCKDSEPVGAFNNARLVACLRDLPYQSGRPLSPIRGEVIGDTALVDYSTTHSTLDRQVYVSLHEYAWISS